MDPTTCFVGIDVAKTQLDIAVRPSGEHWMAPNDEAGIAQLVTRLHELGPTLVVLEATGGLEIPLAAALAATGIPLAVVNPRQVRDFAKAVGRLAKTDALDAHLLAHFADAIRPTPRPVPDAQAQLLSALLARRRQIIGMLVAEQQRLGTTLPPVRLRVETHIAWLRQELAAVDTELQQAIQQSPVWREKDHLLRTVPGVGPVLAMTLPPCGPSMSACSPPVSRRRSPSPLACTSSYWLSTRSCATAWAGRTPSTLRLLDSQHNCLWRPWQDRYRRLHWWPDAA